MSNDSNVDGDGVERRRFLATMSRWAAAGAALFAVPACQSGEEFMDDVLAEKDHGMYGPIRKAERWLKRDLAVDAVPLLHPYNDGRVFSRNWAVGHIVRGDQNQLVMVLVDLETGGHAEVEIFAWSREVRPVNESIRYGLHINDGGHGDKVTPRHIRRLCRALADIIKDNERAVALTPHPPTLHEAVALRRAQESANDPVNPPPCDTPCLEEQSVEQTLTAG